MELTHFPQPLFRRELVSKGSPSTVLEQNAIKPVAGNEIQLSTVPQDLLKAYRLPLFGVQVDDLVSQATEEQIARYDAGKPVMSFTDFLTKVAEDPQRYLPTTTSYIERAFERYGSETQEILGDTVPVYNASSVPWRSPLLSRNNRVIGQEQVIAQFVKQIHEFDIQGQPNRIVIFYGPKGCGKSEIAKMIMETLEHYSQLPEGTRYSFSWRFGKQPLLPSVYGIGNSDDYSNRFYRDSQNASQLRNQFDSDVLLPAALNMHPIFLLPLDVREKLFTRLRDNGKLPSEFNVDYFIRGGLDIDSRNIYDAILKRYGGNLKKLLNDHIVVESWQMSRQKNRGLSTVEPSASRDAGLNFRQFPVNYNRLPGYIQRLSFYNPEGYLPDANGGIIYYDDMGRDLDSARYISLITTGETGELAINDSRATSIREQLNTVIMSSANPDSLAKLMGESQWAALKDKVSIIPVGHLRRFEKESELYQDYVDTELEKGRVVTPHVLEAFSLFLVLTRMFPVNIDYSGYKKLYKNKENDKITNEPLLKGLVKLTTDPIAKALLYQGRDINQGEILNPTYTEEEELALKSIVKLIANEYNFGIGEVNHISYEGAQGLSVRWGQDHIPDVITRHQNLPLTVLDVFESLASKVQADLSYRTDLMKIYSQDGRMRGPILSKSSTPEQNAFQPAQDLLVQVEDYMKNQLKQEFKNALGIYRETDTIIGDLEEYLINLESVMTGKDYLVRDGRRTNEKVKVDYMERIEKLLGLESNKRTESSVSKLRKQMYEKRFSPEWDSSLSDAENIRNVYRVEINKVLSKEDQDHEEKVKNFAELVVRLKKEPDFVKALPPDEDSITPYERIESALGKLEQQGYPRIMVPTLIKWAFESGKYISDETYKVDWRKIST